MRKQDLALTKSRTCRFGTVEDSFIPTDRETGRPRGFGFVTLESNAATTAMNELNNTGQWHHP